jgi:hypothetical protein
MNVICILWNSVMLTAYMDIAHGVWSLLSSPLLSIIVSNSFKETTS